MNQFINTILATIIFVNARSQTITGKISTSNGHPIEGTSISILNKDRVAVSDKEGAFTFFEIPPEIIS